MDSVYLVLGVETLNADLNKYCAYDYWEDLRMKVFLFVEGLGLLNVELNPHLPQFEVSS